MFRFTDDLGPAKIVHVHEPSADLKAILVVDNVAAGPSIGGIRMAPDVSLEECVRLARAMTLKNAAAGIPHGGGKAVVYGDPRMDSGTKERLIRALAATLRDIREYILAPDMGTDERCMAWIRDEVNRVVALPRELGGIPLDEIGATGWGLSHAVQVAVEHCDFELQGARLVVQGFGAVGRHAARYLERLGVRLVATCDSRGAIFNAHGLDLEALLKHKAAGLSVAEFDGGEVISHEDLVRAECDIWIPAARPDVINADNVARLRTHLVVQGANIPCTAEAESYLHERGVLCIPDFIANAGGVICAAVEYHGGSESAAMQTIQDKIRRNVSEVLERSAASGSAPRFAALEMATARVRRAMAGRRWSLLDNAPRIA
jgi:glutamate dehydrogenase (NAD(P)+)